MALRNSLLYALAASALALILGMLVAVATTSSRLLSRWLNWLVMLPLGTSAVTFGPGAVSGFRNERVFAALVSAG